MLGEKELKQMGIFEQMCWIKYNHLKLHEKYNFYTTLRDLTTLASRNHSFTLKQYNAPGVIHVIGRKNTVIFYWQKIASSAETPAYLRQYHGNGYWLYLPSPECQVALPQTEKYKLFLG
jgi:hypothetical protein